MFFMLKIGFDQHAKIDIKLIPTREENKSLTIINVKIKIYSKHLFTYYMKDKMINHII